MVACSPIRAWWIGWCERRKKQAQFRDSQKPLDNFDFAFNKKMNRSLVFDLSTGTFISRHEDALFLGPPGTGKSHLAQAIGQAAIQQGYRVLYRETHALLDDLAEATLDGTRKEHMEFLVTVPLLILDDLGIGQHAGAADCVDVALVELAVPPALRLLGAPDRRDPEPFRRTCQSGSTASGHNAPSSSSRCR